MNLSYEKIFLSICELGSFAAAAKQQHISQPAVSMIITSLEKQLDQKLIIRNQGSKNITLTSAGLKYKKYAQSAIFQYETMLYSLHSDIEESEITILTSPAPASTIWPPLYNAFHRAFPQITLHNITCNGPDVFRRLQYNEADIALSGISQNYPEFITERFFYDPLLFICPINMDINSTISVKEFLKLPLIARKNELNLKPINEILTKHKIDFSKANIIMQVPSNPDIYHAVTLGSGAGFVTKSLLTSISDSSRYVKVVNIANLEFPRHIHLVRNKIADLPQSAKLFWNFAASSSWRKNVFSYPTSPLY